MALEVHDFRIEGVSSLLMHSPKAMSGGGAPTSTGPKKIPTPEEEAELGAYRDEDGSLYLPSNAFRSSILYGAGGRRVGKTAARTVIAGSVFNVEPRTSLVHPETGEKLRDYRIHVARVVVQRNGVLRARPEVPEWAAIVRLEIDLDFIQPFLVEELFNVAGRISGVGDWRPQTKGPHGRYTATLLGSSEGTAVGAGATSENGAPG